jgi:hypothetical protein
MFFVNVALKYGCLLIYCYFIKNEKETCPPTGLLSKMQQTELLKKTN